MEKVTVKKLHNCVKCGNVMVNRVIKRDSDKLERILQCIVCKYWVPLD